MQIRCEANSATGFRWSQSLQTRVTRRSAREASFLHVLHRAYRPSVLLRELTGNSSSGFHSPQLEHDLPDGRLPMSFDPSRHRPRRGCLPHRSALSHPELYQISRKYRGFPRSPTDRTGQRPRVRLCDSSTALYPFSTNTKKPPANALTSDPLTASTPSINLLRSFYQTTAMPRSDVRTCERATR